MPAPGALLAGRYRILSPLGAGGMATVHRARDERLQRDVAVKILLPNQAGDPVLAARFEREARSLAAAAHPGVVAIFDVDPGDPAAGVEPFLVMELCQGGSLADRLSGGRPLSPDELIPILISVADGLAGLHAGGVVHRDVKPSNILLASARAKLADFGLARSDDPNQMSDLTAPGTAVGTMSYLAPDVLAGETAGPAGDVYALGVAAFAGLTGSMPRSEGSIAELVAAGGQPAPTVSSVAPGLGRAFDAAVAAALDPDPARRPDATAFAVSLTSALGQWSRSRSGSARSAGSTATDPDARTAVVRVPAIPMRQDLPGRPPSARRERRSMLPPNSLLAAVLVGALIVGVLAFTNGGRPGVEPAGPTVPPSAVALITASPSPSPPPATPEPTPDPTPVPTPIPTPVPTLSVTERALVALDGVDVAVEDVRDSGDLRNKDINDLEKRAKDVRSAVDRDDLDAAKRAADALAAVARKVGDDLNNDLDQRLEDAVAEVVNVLRDR